MGLPDAYGFDAEPNRWLRRYKSARKEKWMLTRADSLWQMSDLALCFLALNRWSECLSVSEYPARNVPFDGNYNIWTPVAVCISIRYHTLRLLGEVAEANQSIEVLRRHPSRKPFSPESMAVEIAEWDEHFTEIMNGIKARAVGKSDSA